ncbi:MAG TPA: hypothetical protein VIV55_09900 [Flavobacterium sp.]
MKNDTIHRYPLQLKTGKQGIVMPEGAELLTVQIQDRNPVLWALMNPFNKKIERFFQLFQTGEAICSNNNEYVYISSFQLVKQGASFHVFEVITV